MVAYREDARTLPSRIGLLGMQPILSTSCRPGSGLSVFDSRRCSRNFECVASSVGEAPLPPLPLAPRAGLRLGAQQFNGLTLQVLRRCWLSGSHQAGGASGVEPTRHRTEHALR